MLAPASLPPSQPATIPTSPAAEPAPPAPLTPPDMKEEPAGAEEPTTATGPAWDDEPAPTWTASATASEEPAPALAPETISQTWDDPAIVSISSAPAASEIPPLQSTVLEPTTIATAPNITNVTATSAASTPALSPPPGLSTSSPPTASAKPAGLSKKGLNRFKSSDSPVILPNGVGLGGSPLSFGQFGGTTSSVDRFGMQFGSLSLGDDGTDA